MLRSNLIPILAKKRAQFSDNFTGGLNSRWQYTNSAWTASGGAALCTPTLGAELFTNGTFAADTNWTKGTGWTIGSGAGNHAAGTASNLTQNVGTVGGWFRVGYDITSISGSYSNAIYGAASNLGRQYTSPQSVVSISRQITSSSLGIRADTSTVCTVDNATAKRITLEDMFASISGFKTSATISVNATIPTQDAPCGVVGWLDSYTTPANFIVCFHDGSFLKLLKCVAGTYTSLISTVVSYSAGASIILRGVRSGSDLLLTAYYNGAPVGTQQTVSDAGIVSNTRHGMFSSISSNTIDSFIVK